jgi:hypothetical protein
MARKNGVGSNQYHTRAGTDDGLGAETDLMGVLAQQGQAVPAGETYYREEWGLTGTSDEVRRQAREINSQIQMTTWPLHVVGQQKLEDMVRNGHPAVVRAVLASRLCTPHLQELAAQRGISLPESTVSATADQEPWDGDLDNVGPDRKSIALSDVPDGELCYVFQHFDSRGGTVGVWAADREQAGEIYWKRMFGGEEYTRWSIEEDYSGMAWFHLPPDFVGQTLDLDDEAGPTVVMVANAGDDFPTEADLPPGQVPILRCFQRDDIELVGDVDEGETQTYTDQSGCRWSRVRWDDDAFGFLSLWGPG